MYDCSKILYSFYDFQVCPTTFDIVNHLCVSEMVRKSLGCTSLHLVFVPSVHEGGFRHDQLNAVKEEHLRWRLKNILLQSAQLLESCKGVSILGSREEAASILSLAKHVYPHGYSLEAPAKGYLNRHVLLQWLKGSDLPAFVASRTAHELVGAWIRENCKEKKILTITLRRSSYVNTVRNSDLDNWGAFIASLKGEYAVVVLDDFENIFQPLPKGFEECLTFPSTMFSLELRSSLYQYAFLNLSVPNGPTVLFRKNHHCRYLIFSQLNQRDLATNYTTFLSHLLIRPGENYAWSTPFQRLIWADQSYASIRENFDMMVDLIKSRRYVSKRSIFEYVDATRRKMIKEEHVKGVLKELVQGGALINAINILHDLALFEEDPKVVQQYHSLADQLSNAIS
jgi:hypothetical protein